MKICDGYVILKYEIENEKFARLYTCEFGGYLDGDHWRLSSNIAEISEDDDWNGEGTMYFIRTYSSSLYHIHSSQYEKMTSFCRSTLSGLLSSVPEYKIMSIEEYLKEEKE